MWINGHYSPGTGIYNSRVQYLSTYIGYYVSYINSGGYKWAIVDYYHSIIYYATAVDGCYPPSTGWVAVSGSPPAPTIVRSVCPV
jgi:hypothetical protein